MTFTKVTMKGAVQAKMGQHVPITFRLHLMMVTSAEKLLQCVGSTNLSAGTTIMQRFGKWLVRYGIYATIFWIPFWIKYPYFKWEWLGLILIGRLILVLITALIFQCLHKIGIVLYRLSRSILYKLKDE